MEIKPGRIHSVSKEMHHKFIGFPCDPGSRSGDPDRVVFYEIYYKVHPSTLRKRNTTFHGVFVLRLSV